VCTGADQRVKFFVAQTNSILLFVVLRNECREGRGNGDEAAQRADELVERVRHLERNDKEREGERERGSLELRPRDL